MNNSRRDFLKALIATKILLLYPALAGSIWPDLPFIKALEIYRNGGEITGHNR